MITRTTNEHINNPTRGQRISSAASRSMTPCRQTARPRRVDGRLKVRNPFTFATYNVRTLNKPGRFYQLTDGCFKHNLDFIAVQEHRWKALEGISVHKNDRYQFLYSGASERGQGGIGILVKNKLTCCITKRTKVSDRILSITLNCNPKVTIVATYYARLKKRLMR